MIGRLPCPCSRAGRRDGRRRVRAGAVADDVRRRARRAAAARGAGDRRRWRPARRRPLQRAGAAVSRRQVRVVLRAERPGLRAARGDRRDRGRPPTATATCLDTDQQLVQVFDAAGASVRCFGGRGHGLGKLHTSSGSYAASSASGGIAVAGDFVYVADASNNRVQRFTLTGKNPKILGKGKLKMPQGLAVKGSRLLVADDGNHRVVELTTSGRFVRATSAQDGRPPALPLRRGLRRPRRRLRRRQQPAPHRPARPPPAPRPRLGRRRATATASSSSRARVAIQPNGHVFVADAGNDRVQEFTKTGGFVRSIGINGRARPHVTAPADVAANAFGEVAVADGNGRISWFDLAGRATGAWAPEQVLPAARRPSSPSRRASTSPPTARCASADNGSSCAPSPTRSVSDLLTVRRSRARARPASTSAPSGTAWAVAARASSPASRTPRTAKPTWLGTAARGRPQHDRDRRAERRHARDLRGHVAQPDPPGRRHRRATTTRPASCWRPGRSRGPRAASRRSRPAWRRRATAASGSPTPTTTASCASAADGTIAQTLGTPGTGAGQLAEPRGLELDCAGGLLVADSGNNRIERFAGVAPARGCAHDHHADRRRPSARARRPARQDQGPRQAPGHPARHDHARPARAPARSPRSRASSGVIAGGQLRSFPLDGDDHRQHDHPQGLGHRRQGDARRVEEGRLRHRRRHGHRHRQGRRCRYGGITLAVPLLEVGLEAG